MTTDIVCANALIIRDGQILLTREAATSAYYLPGGKVMAGETLPQALKRELNEELTLDYQENQFQAAFQQIGPAYNQPTKRVVLNCYFIPVATAYQVGAEVYDYRWCELQSKNVAPVVQQALHDHAWIFAR
ncbi:NUDIX hydrolase [Lactiplantibacillus daowaiensis]|uniref:NUDIX domain-containing protein n=1 Tax=Lactiplantibacillus daowaiensis TaxID=2559918 RepID=A0ABW1S2J2_9LACO